jgi:hypothetical protein
MRGAGMLDIESSHSMSGNPKCWLRATSIKSAAVPHEDFVLGSPRGFCGNERLSATPSSSSRMYNGHTLDHGHAMFTLLKPYTANAGIATPHMQNLESSVHANLRPTQRNADLPLTNAVMQKSALPGVAAWKIPPQFTCSRL